MKKIILSIALLISCSSATAVEVYNAKKSYPAGSMVEMTNPDGRYFNAVRWGNEFCSGWATTDGFTISKDADGYWNFVVLNKKGLLVAGTTPAWTAPKDDMARYLQRCE